MLFENSREQTMPFYKSKFWEYPEVNDVPKVRARPTINGLVLISGHKRTDRSQTDNLLLSLSV